MGDVWLQLRHRLPHALAKEQWLADIESYYADHRAELTPTPSAVETVRLLRRMGIRQVCVSNSGRRIVNANLEFLGILDCIEFSISLDDVAVGKPDPFPYAEACRMMGVACRHTLAVEDSRTGIHSARSAGLVVAGYSVEKWVGDDIDIDLRHLGDLVKIFSPSLS